MKFLKLCQQIEKMTGELYRIWSTQDQFPVELRTTWKSLAEEEDIHYRELQLALSLASENVMGEPTYPEAELNQIIAGIDRLIKEAKARPIPEKEALQHAIKLEGSMHEAHLVHTLNFREQKIKNLFNALSSADKSHFETLNRYLVSRGYVKPKSPQ